MIAKLFWDQVGTKSGPSSPRPRYTPRITSPPSTPIASQISRNSTTSSLLSAFSTLEIYDCGLPTRRASSVWLKPFSFLHAMSARISVE